MNRAQFESLARTLRDRDITTRAIVVRVLLDWLRSQNPNFDSKKFLKACDLDSAQIPSRPSPGAEAEPWAVTEVVQPLFTFNIGGRTHRIPMFVCEQRTEHNDRQTGNVAIAVAGAKSFEQAMAGHGPWTTVFAYIKPEEALAFAEHLVVNAGRAKT